MYIKSYSITFAIAVILLVSQPARAEDTSTDVNNMLNSLSNILSNTNPKPAEYKNAEPEAGEVEDAPPPDVKKRVASLPPLVPPIHAGNSQVSEPEPEAVPVATQNVKIIQPEVDYERLSPETRRILHSTPSGIGSQPRSKGENISMKMGDFDPEYGNLLDQPIDKTEDPAKVTKFAKIEKSKDTAAAPKAPVKYDIKLQNGKTGEGLLDILDKALRALNAGQYEVSIVLYKSALQKDSRNQDALFGLAAAYQKAGQKAQARDAYAKLLKLYPTFQPGLNNLLVLASTESPSDALKELDEIGARNPNFAPVYAQKASIYAEIGDSANAKKNFLKALSIEPDNIIYRYNLAVELDQSGDVINAAQLYNQILDQNARGAKLPVERIQIEERLAFIGSSHPSKS